MTAGCAQLFNAQGTQPPLILVTTWTENLAFDSFATALGGDQPLVILGPPAAEPFPEFTDRWVDFFLDQLHRYGARPPFYLAGHSYGGVIALEMARRLRSGGDRVDYVGLIDTWRPKLNPQGLSAYVEYHLAALLELPSRERMPYASNRVREYLRRELSGPYRAGRNHLRRVVGAPEKPDFKTVLGPLRRAIWVSYLRYQPSRYDEPVSIYACAESLARQGQDPSLGWAQWFPGGFDRATITGTHNAIFESQHAGSLVEAIHTSLSLGRIRSSADEGRATG
jgi:thioesterase domain-containing protein